MRDICSIIYTYIPTIYEDDDEGEDKDDGNGE